MGETHGDRMMTPQVHRDAGIPSTLKTGSVADDEIRTSLIEWRVRALLLVLLVVAVAGIPAYILPIVNAIRDGQMTPLLWVYLAIYGALVALAVLPRITPNVRGWGAISFAYANAIASFARVGLVGSGRLYLIALPVVATIAIGVRAGYVTAVVSFLIYIIFAGLAQAGILSTWITVQENPVDLSYWFEAGAAVAVFLISLLMLLNSFYRLFIRTLSARQEAGKKLEQAAKMLWEQDERLALVLEGTNDGIWDWDLKTDDVYFSPRWKGMLGFQDHEIANRFEEWRRLIHPDDVGRAIATVQAYLEGRTSVYELEHRLQHKDGTYRWILARGIALRDDSGKAYRMAGSHTDITARIEANEEIRRQNEYLAALHETTLGVVSRLDVNELLEITVARAVKLASAAFGWVYLLTPDKDAIQVQVGTGKFHRFIGLRIQKGDGVAGKVWESGTRLSVDDYSAWEGRSHHFDDDSIGPSLGVPLKSGNEVVGVIGLSRERGSLPFRWDEQDLIGRFGQLVSIALDNARMHTSLQQELTERVNAEATVQRRLAFEKIISSISTDFINLGPDEIEPGITHALETIGRFASCDRSYVFRVSEDGERISNTYEWCAPGVESFVRQLQGVPTARFPYFVGQIRQDRVVSVPRVRDLPPEAASERQAWLREGVAALICVPIVYRGTAIGWVGFDSRGEREWDQDTVTLLRITSEIFANALEHQRAQRALRQSESRFRAIFERAAIGIGVTGTDGTLLEVNPALVRMFGYDERELRQLPATTKEEQPVYEELMAGRRDQYQIEKRYRHKDGRIVWGRLTNSLARGDRDEPLFAIGMVEDITEQKQAQEALQLANQTLEGRVAERTRELSTLLEIVQAAAGSLDLEQVLERVSHGLTAAVGIPYCGIYLVDETKGRLTPVPMRRSQNPQISQAYIATPLDPTQDAFTREILETRRPAVCFDAESDPRTNKETVRILRLRSILGVPFVVKDRVAAVAMLVTTDTQHVFTEEQIALAWGIVNAAAVSIENARLYNAERDRHAEAERRRQVAEGLRDILAVLNSDRPFAEILDHIVAQAARLLGANAGLVFHLDPDQNEACTEATYDLLPELVAIGCHRFDEAGGRTAILKRRPVGLVDLSHSLGAEQAADPDLSDQDRRWHALISENYRSYLGLPVIIKDKLYGGLGLYYRERREFTEEDYRLGMSIGHQTALAIENAQLRAQSEQAAAITERNRLARELHDSVTQSLYSVTLYAEAAARLLVGGKAQEAAEHLRDLRDTAQEALREMRLLIFELRPLVLEKSGLAGAIQTRLDAVEVRGGIAATLTTVGEENLSATVQQELYHIVHEALNNTLKHARATSVTIRLEFGDVETTLEVCDDGSGFAPETAQQSGGLGLKGMRERADRIGGTITILSQLGHGTLIRVYVPSGPAAAP